jgi:hypothetical protein
MQSRLYSTGKIVPANSGRSFKVYLLVNEEFVFVGLVTRKALEALLRWQIPQADICKFDHAPPQEPLNGFSLRLEEKQQ